MAEAAGERVPEIYELKICQGWNPILPEMIGSRRLFTFSIPAGGDRFFLEKERGYLIEARTEIDGPLTRRRFVAP